MGIRKRKNGEGSISKRSDGRYNVSLGSVYTTAKDYQTARAKLKELKEKAARGDPVTVQRTSVENYMKDWLVSKKNSLKPASYKRLEQTFNNQVIKYIGGLQMQALRADDIQDMVNEVFEKQSYSTVKKAFDCVNECMRCAVRKRQLVFNPCEGVILPKKPVRTVEDEEMCYYTPEQIKLIVEEASRKHSNGTPVYKYGQVILLLLATGMREGEVLYLKWKSVDIENRKLLVCGNVVEAEHTLIEQDTPKTDSGNRIIPLNNRAVEALLSLGKCRNGDRVVSTNNGKAVYPSSIRRTMNSIVRECGISEIKSKVHALRHTFAVTLIRGGTDIKAVSQILGHSDITVTLGTYHHIIDEQRKNAVNIIDDIF